MKKIFLTIISAAAILTACNQEVIMQNGTGSLDLNLSCKMDYTEVETKAVQTDEEIINALSIDIVRPYDGWKVNYTPFSSIKGKVVELGSGSYILTASSPVKEEAAFDQPIFEGSKGFDITVGEVTNISLQCVITNMKVDIKLSENFVSELSDYTITVSNGKANLLWKKTSTEDDFELVTEGEKKVYANKKSGYFKVAPLTITVDGHRKIDNTSASTTYIISEVAAANNYIICLDAQVIGTLGGINITISNEVNPIEQPVVVPGFEEVPVPGDDPVGGDDNTGDDNTGDDNTGSDDNTGTEPEPSTTPTLEWPANPDFSEMLIDDNMNADMVVKVPGKIAEFTVVVNSASLTPAIKGLTSDGTETMDLINDAGLIEFLAGAAPTLPTGTNLEGATTVDFKLTEFIGMIALYKPEAGAKHSFTLNVTDKADQTLTKTVTFVTPSAN